MCFQYRAYNPSVFVKNEGMYAFIVQAGRYAIISAYMIHSFMSYRVICKACGSHSDPIICSVQVARSNLIL